MSKKCSICDAPIVYSYNIENDIYYLRCRKDYEHYHRGCNKETALKYPKLTTKNEFILDEILEQLNDPDSDYPNLDNLLF